ncbi:MAG: hypothetical protein R2783_10005, partial [Gelidibacter sp.]
VDDGGATVVAVPPPSPAEVAVNGFFHNLTEEQNTCLAGNRTLRDAATAYIAANIVRSMGEVTMEWNVGMNAATFATAAIEAVCNGGEVDFEESRINGIKLGSNLPNCASSMVLNFMLKNPENSTSTLLIDKVFSALGNGMPINDRDFITTFRVGNISGNGATTVVYNPTTQKYEATVTLSQNLINNGTKLAVAKTILHESIHAFLKYTAKQFPLLFTNPDGDFSTLVAAWQVHNDENYAQHVYMANLIEDMATDLGLFTSEQYFYPDPFISSVSIAYYEAVAWSGVALISDPTGAAPYIENPVFVQIYPSANDRDNIIKIFNTENGTATYSGYSPLINNNCN